MGSEGQKFLQQCREAGKEVCVWTVNDIGEMKVALSWGVKAILTDRVGTFTKLKQEVGDLRSSSTVSVFNKHPDSRQIVQSPEKLELQGHWKYTFGWSHWRYYSMAHVCANVLAPLVLSAHGSLPKQNALPPSSPSPSSPLPDSVSSHLPGG